VESPGGTKLIVGPSCFLFFFGTSPTKTLSFGLQVGNFLVSQIPSESKLMRLGTVPFVFVNDGHKVSKLTNILRDQLVAGLGCNIFFVLELAFFGTKNQSGKK
jgi:hypothetical protein